MTYGGTKTLDAHVREMAHLGTMVPAVFAPDTLTPMWPHFVSLLHRAWQSFLGGQGTTALGLITPVLVSVVSAVLTLFVIFLWRGKDELMRHWKGNTAIAVLSAVVVNVLVYGVIFTRSFVHAGFDDHEALKQRVRQLHNENVGLTAELNEHNGPKDKQIAALQKQLGQQCYLPDRQFTKEQRDLLYTTFKGILRDWKEPPPTIVLGSFPGDHESEHIRSEIEEVALNAGFRRGSTLKTFNQEQLDWVRNQGFPAGMLISGEVPNDGRSVFLRQLFAGMDFFPQMIGKMPNAEKGTILLWVGYKTWPY
jgi:hypothetical protein